MVARLMRIWCSPARVARCSAAATTAIATSARPSRPARRPDENFPDITPHELRQRGVVKALQRMLGQAKAAMALDVYADLFDDDLDAVAE